MRPTSQGSADGFGTGLSRTCGRKREMIWICGGVGTPFSASGERAAINPPGRWRAAVHCASGKSRIELVTISDPLTKFGHVAIKIIFRLSGRNW